MRYIIIGAILLTCSCGSFRNTSCQKTAVDELKGLFVNNESLLYIKSDCSVVKNQGMAVLCDFQGGIYCRWECLQTEPDSPEEIRDCVINRGE